MIATHLQVTGSCLEVEYSLVNHSLTPRRLKLGRRHEDAARPPRPRHRLPSGRGSTSYEAHRRGASHEAVQQAYAANVLGGGSF